MKKEIKKINQSLPYLLLGVALVFNLLTLWPEIGIKSDPNDNIFQFGLINRMDQTWKEVFQGNVSPLSLVDHWVPNWAVGYPLPFYYSHLPHLLIVASHKVVQSFLSLFGWFHLLQFLILAFTPLAFFFGARKFGFNRLTSSLVALFASQLSTDGLYGIDISSYIWRGYGLSLQALSVFFLPLFLGSVWEAVEKNKKYLAAILWLTACLAAHIATGYIGLLSCALIPLALVKLPLESFKKAFKELTRSYFRLSLVLMVTFLLLAYWFVPLFLNNQYHGVSFWDSPSKWFSYGFKNVINLFIQGELLDFGRRPILTGLAIIGFFVAAYKAQKPKYRFFCLLFPFWLVLFFGRPTLGGLLNFLPLTKDYHLHRFIIGFHLSSLFLIGIGANWLWEKLASFKFSLSLENKKTSLPFNLILPWLMIALIIIPVFRQTFHYADDNRQWLSGANQQFEKDYPDFEKILTKLSELPRGRINAGRPGNWGREFKVGPTPVYMALSARGFETTGFLPETWSLNSDSEQFFNEFKPEHYNLYNVRYLITPLDFKTPDFAQEILVSGQYRLSQTETSGYFTLGHENFSLLSKKENILNPVHAWLASDWVGSGQFPTLRLKKDPASSASVKMADEINYLYLGQKQNLFKQPLFGKNQEFKTEIPGRIIKEKAGFQEFETEVELNPDCQNCLVVFKMTYHPNWQVKLNNQPAEKIHVFPSLMAVKVRPGKQTLSFKYLPHQYKGLLLFLGVLVLSGFGWLKKSFIEKK